MARAPRTQQLPALARLVAEKERAGEVVVFSLPGGAPLFLAGEPADQIFWLRTGRLGVFDNAGEHGTRLLGLVRPGEPIGEMSLIAGAPHGASVIALRDCEIVALSREVLFAAAQKDPALMAELARLAIVRARGVLAPPEPGAAAFGFLSLAPAVDVRALTERIAEAIRAVGYRITVVGAEHQGKRTHWFSNLEMANDFVLFAAEAREEAWAAFVGRQADHIFWIGEGQSTPPPARGPHASLIGARAAPADLILMQSVAQAVPLGGEAWFAALSPARMFHLRQHRSGDIERIARIVTGRAVGLVLSGGAARAYAHIGAIRVLKAQGTPIDLIAGSSMGAIIGAGLAMEWDMAELERRVRKAFVESSPVADIALPLVALSRGGLMRRRLAEHFDDRTIGDLWLPFVCVSSNLTTGALKLHREGLVRDALAASSALPGVLPPVVRDKDVLVDGAIMNNFPADVLRQLHTGPIVGVDVTRGRSLEASAVTPASLLRWLLAGDWRKGPPIVSLLIRAATVGGAPHLALSRIAADLLIQPMVDDIEVRDWRAYDAGVSAGEKAAEEALARLETSIVDLRRTSPTLASSHRIDPLRRT